ncbi:MAG: PIN domain-containing protein, partial [Pyrinomonadaceae bacterium]
MTGDCKYFLDSNICLYALSDEDDEKAATARKLVSDLADDIGFTVQIVNEVCINLKRKSRLSEKDLRTLTRSFFLRYRFVDVSETALLSASELRERHDFSFWDSIIVSS